MSRIADLFNFIALAKTIKVIKPKIDFPDLETDKKYLLQLHEIFQISNFNYFEIINEFMNPENKRIL